MRKFIFAVFVLLLLLPTAAFAHDAATTPEQAEP